MRLSEDTALRVEPSFAHGTPPELSNLPRRISVDELLQTWLVMTVKPVSAKTTICTARRLMRYQKVGLLYLLSSETVLHFVISARLSSKWAVFLVNA